jgi:hypothetical protein
VSDPIKMRLQGGPFDGQCSIDRCNPEIPERIYVNRCVHCGSHWYRVPERGCELYRRDGEKDGVHLYVWTDPKLGDRERESEHEKELTAAGGGRC